MRRLKSNLCFVPPLSVFLLFRHSICHQCPLYNPFPSARQIKGFATPADVDAWLLANPYTTTGALHFAFTPSGALGYGIQTNATVKSQRGQFEDATFDYQVPLQAAAEREIARYIAQDWTLTWTPSYAEFAHPAISAFSAVGSAGATFLFAAAMFSFVTQASNLVTERELKLRQAMSTMGLMDSVFWLTWFLWEFLLAIISCILLVCFGMMFQFDFFLHNAFLVLFLMFFLFWLSMTSLAFFVSTFLRKASTANTVGFFIFIIGFVLQLIVLFGVPYSKEYSNGLRIIFNLFPPDLLAIGLKYLGDATATPEDPGIKLSTIGQCSPRSPDCVMTMAGIYVWLLVLTIVYFILAVYLDNVLPDVNGIRKPCFFFLYPSFWTGRASGGEHGGLFSCFGRKVPELDPNDRADDADVIEEEEKVKAAAAAAGGGEAANVSVSVRGLVKTFPGRTEMKRCCVIKKSPAFHAVKGSWFGVEKDKLFCLLGPNGAGKSTTIHCLTGIIPTTAGDALVLGSSIRDPGRMARIRGSMGVCPQLDILWNLPPPLFPPQPPSSPPASPQLLSLGPPSATQAAWRAYGASWACARSLTSSLVLGSSIRDPGSMARIRGIMGVCPQFDILWDRLSGAEHLYLFARIKGLPPAHTHKEVATLLEEVRLTEAQKMRTRAYSGGMKRRLSVAVALIGDPKVVYLDEPTTGMDPVSRRHVWDIVERAKKGPAIVLTAHSMEEADILGDRIAIMALLPSPPPIHTPQAWTLCPVATCMDPVSRRHVWDIVERAKKGRAIVLTTHSMEEADILGDRIAIMARGRLRCIGTSIHLKNRFGAGFLVTVGIGAKGGTPSAVDLQADNAAKAAVAEKASAVKAYFKEVSGARRAGTRKLDVEASDESKGYVKFLVPRDREPQLTAFFKELNDSSKELGITDTQLSLSTLEEVFLNIARQAELETAQAEGRFENIVLTNGLSVQVPVGAELVSLPATEEFPQGSLIDVSWQQDDTGTLRISKFSEQRETTAEAAADAVPARWGKSGAEKSFWARMCGCCS
ncbi:unnamed protein product [Closterium sp. Naga37s-1]|nr:unnamed protein product [Closterium sp. Naga37s-1]